MLRFLLASLLIIGNGSCSSSSREVKSSPVVEVAWSFEPPERGAMLSSPVVDGHFVFIYTIRDGGFQGLGAVHALDVHSGKRLWSFDDDGEMRHGYSTPCVAGNRIFVGEGMHANHFCKLYCLDRESGKKLWSFTAEGHLESSPVVHENRVIFGAGDDGVYCLKGDNGEVVWHFADRIHVDSRPEIEGSCLHRRGMESSLSEFRDARSGPQNREPALENALGSPGLGITNGSRPPRLLRTGKWPAQWFRFSA